MKQPYNLFLDDVRNPEDCLNHMQPFVGTMTMPLYHYTEYVIVRNYNEFVQHITENGLPLLVSFDHDLGREHQEYYHLNIEGTLLEEKLNHVIDYDQFSEKTGYSAAKWLVNYCMDNNLKLPATYVHSANPVGRRNIESLFDNAIKKANL